MSNCGKAISKAAPEWPMASTSFGVKVMSLHGRLNRERERLAGSGMTDEERAWRAQWIRDQRLSENEPMKVPQAYKALYNPIRRLYRFPLDKLEKQLTPKLGEASAALCRNILAKSGMMIVGVYVAAYYFKYNTNDWTRKGGWRVVPSRRSVVPGDPGWPYQPERTVGADYADRGFKNSPIQKPLTTTPHGPSVTQHKQEAVASPELEVAGKPVDELQDANLSRETFELSEKVDV